MLAQLLSDVRVAKPNPEPANVESSQAELAGSCKGDLCTFDSKLCVVCGKLLGADGVWGDDDPDNGDVGCE